jgi:hypothetical protein
MKTPDQCDRFEMLIFEKIDRTIAADCEAELDEHLKSCQKCQAFYNQALKIDSELVNAFNNKLLHARALEESILVKAREIPGKIPQPVSDIPERKQVLKQKWSIFGILLNACDYIAWAIILLIISEVLSRLYFYVGSAGPFSVGRQTIIAMVLSGLAFWGGSLFYALKKSNLVRVD